MREKYESLSLAVLKELAKARGMRGISTMKKSDLIGAMLAQDEKDRQSETAEASGQAAPDQSDTAHENGTARRRSQTARTETEAGHQSGPVHRTETAAREKNENSYGHSSRRENNENGYGNGYRRENNENNYGNSPRRENNENSYGNGYRRENNENGYGNSSRRENNENSYGNGYRRENNENSYGNGYRRENNESSEARTDRPPTELSQLDSGIVAKGILEVMPDGFGFIRSDNYMPGENDVYVSPSQIRRFNLKTGDIISGNMRIRAQQEKFGALLYLKTINGKTPAEAMRRHNFEDMTPIFPNERLRMERGTRATAMRIVDLFSPIGKGQRGMIVSPPKAGKTTLLKDVAHSILENDPKMRLLILLIDERPEEVTDIKEAICGENVEVIYSTFDELPEHHKRVSEMVIERAKRLVEQNEDVTILLDSITRLARAYNMTVPPSGRTLSGGLDPAALHMPKRFFGAARNMREGGSLTILATALVDTGSKMDDVVYEEFKGTGNMELVLDRKLSEKRVFPAIDFPKSGTRRDDLLLDREEQEAVYIMRRALNGMKSDEAVENILNMFVHTRDNRELVQKVRRQKFI
ncbi:MAG: transcription termination factor Rho [Lachnospiraceae bacterium]|uniref:transcription termination factor Rho n=1 Tax=Parablautia sp. Marseille-Q6255 TaxID=3039593 RepID=UPI0024BD282A|nr:transcription termination factor Rho [Parablautia sp. Marseille-Q6255]